MSARRCWLFSLPASQCKASTSSEYLIQVHMIPSPCQDVFRGGKGFTEFSWHQEWKSSPVENRESARVSGLLYIITPKTLNCCKGKQFLLKKSMYSEKCTFVTHVLSSLDETFQGNEKKRRFLFAFQNLLLSLQPQTTKRSFLCHGVDWI